MTKNSWDGTTCSCLHRKEFTCKTSQDAVRFETILQEAHALFFQHDTTKTSRCLLSCCRSSRINSNYALARRTAHKCIPRKTKINLKAISIQIKNRTKYLDPMGKAITLPDCITEAICDLNTWNCTQTFLSQRIFNPCSNSWKSTSLNISMSKSCTSFERHLLLS